MQKLIDGIHQFQGQSFRPLQGLFEQLAKDTLGSWWTR